jgi:ABC-type amino acid transport substrate-binding protein
VPTAVVSAESPTITAIKQRGALRAGYALSPPHLMQDPASGKLFGASYDMAQALADGLGVKLEMVESDWGLFVAGLQADKFDIVSTALFATPERREVIDFVDFGKSGQCYVVLAENERIKTIADLDNPEVTIGTITGGAGEQLIAEAHPLVKIDSAVVGPGQVNRIDDLLAKRIEVSFIDSPTAPIIAKKYPQLRIIPSPVESCVMNPDVPVVLGVGLRQGDPGFKDYVQQVISANQAKIDQSIMQYSTEEFMK